MTDHLYAAIMAGGGGTRLWPLSRAGKPKQSLRLIGDRSLFQMAVERLEPLIPVSRILVLTVEDQAALLRSQVSILEAENFILEPAPRGTASAIGLAAIHMRQRDTDAVMACLTADHYIPAVEAFQDYLHDAYDIAREGQLVTLGITPTNADTGYGYIQLGTRTRYTSAHSSYNVEAFTEKPDSETAQRYLESGKYLWNSGMFIWHVETILKEIERQLPDLYECLVKIERSIGSTDERNVTASLWRELETVTVDYGVMEGAHNVVVLPADDLGWIDVGDWGRLFDILPHDAQGNVIEASQAVMIDSSDILIYQDQESSKRLIAGLGLSDLVIVDIGESIFVCPKSRAAEVKQLIQELKNKGLDRYL